MTNKTAAEFDGFQKAIKSAEELSSALRDINAVETIEDELGDVYDNPTICNEDIVIYLI